MAVLGDKVSPDVLPPSGEMCHHRAPVLLHVTHQELSHTFPSQAKKSGILPPPPPPHHPSPFPCCRLQFNLLRDRKIIK